MKERPVTSSMQITRLDHLVLTVADPAATVDFYVKRGMRAETFQDGRSRCTSVSRS
ncbi:MAG: hypothetical protein WKF96_25745 [Solirubrobacteraceae bacterium]